MRICFFRVFSSTYSMIASDYLLFGGCILGTLVVRARRYETDILVHRDSFASRCCSKLRHEIKTYSKCYTLSLFDPCGVIHSIWYVIMRKLKFARKLVYNREILILEDGGSVALDWRSNDEIDPNAPVVIIHHGLCGHSQSSYVKSMVAQLELEGFHIVVFVARGCGRLPLTTPESFTASRTTDFRAVIEHVVSCNKGRDIHAIGFSLGAGLLLKYLGEHGEEAGLRSAVAISPCFDFHKRTALFGQFSRMAVKGLVKYARYHRKFLEHHPTSVLDFEGMVKARNIYEFDESAIVGRYRSDGSGRFLHHRSVDEYYRTSSCLHVASQITTPTLALCAHDDPVCSIDGAPKNVTQIGKGLAVVKVKHGGHVGFGDSPFGSTYFCDRIAALWMKNSKENL